MSEKKEVTSKPPVTGITPAALLAATQGDVENFFAAITPGGIEAQEAAGQARVCAHNDRLPVRGTEEREKWEALGFVFGEQLTGNDSIFVACTFPPGWKLKPTEHSMWSDLVDDKGVERAMMFFKAAFYDYNAHIQFKQ